jgi:hypothetical protein
MYLICITARWKLNLIHCYWIPFTFEFVTTLKYILIKLRRYLFDCMHINGGFFHQWKLIINRWSIDESHSKRSHQLFIDFQYQSIDKYRLVLIDINTHRLSISSIKYAGYLCNPSLPDWNLYTTIYKIITEITSCCSIHTFGKLHSSPATMCIHYSLENASNHTP